MEVETLKQLQFFVRHHQSFLQKRFLLVFKSDAARDFFMEKLPQAHFQEVSSEQAAYIARFGMQDETVPFGYTMKLTKKEQSELNVLNWEHTAALIAEGNERLYQAAKEQS